MLARFTRTLFATASLRFAAAFQPSSHPLSAAHPALVGSFNRAFPRSLSARGATGPGLEDVPPTSTAVAPDATAPQTMIECITQAQASVAAALAAGHTLLEVEFPPLATDRLDDAITSADDVNSANLRLAVQFATAFSPRNVAIMLPDVPEHARAVELQKLRPAPGVTLHPLRGSLSVETLSEAKSIGDAILGLFGKGRGNIQVVPSADIYICLVFSAQELPDLEELEQLEPGKPIIFFNLKLDTQRGDLGLPAFPSKDLQWRFLSRVLPAYYLRTRSYSRSLPQPPFVINYQGALFRAFPGRYQSLLETGRGRMRAVATAERRIALGEFKAQLTAALRIGGSEGDVEGSAGSFLRNGYKASTWWEDDAGNDELHDTWRC